MLVTIGRECSQTELGLARYLFRLGARDVLQQHGVKLREGKVFGAFDRGERNDQQWLR
jgi:hypothetical protein